MILGLLPTVSVLTNDFGAVTHCGCTYNDFGAVTHCGCTYNDFGAVAHPVLG